MNQTDNFAKVRMDSRCTTTGSHFFLPAASAVLMLFYLALHFWSLPWFPFVHSDEAWLASLSRTIWSGGAGATEDFFVLTPRYPHALKTLYHLIQAPFVMLSWTAVAARVPSLIAGIGSIVIVAILLRRLTGSLWIALTLTAAFALDVQFFYISHLARQEALVLAATMGAVLILVPQDPSAKKEGLTPAAAAATLIGITIFIHPNAFIAACAVFPWILWSAAGGGKRRAAALYVGVLLFWALAALAVSLYLDPQFISYYRSFADTAGVSTGLFERFARFREFFQKMACGHAGTYYLAPIAPQLWALPLVSALALISSRRSAAMVGTASLGMTLLAIFVIGKNSPPSIVFLFPWLYLISGVLFSRIFPKGSPDSGKLRPVLLLRPLLLLLLLAPLATGFQLARTLGRWYPGTYTAWLAQIRATVPEGEIALGNLNTAFAFKPEELRVWRDLGSLPPVLELPPEPTDHELLGRPLARFLGDEKVEWILLPREELDKIYRERPVWNEVYGNPHRFYPDLLLLLERFGTQEARFEGGPYAMRLIQFLDRGPFHLEIYRIKLP